MASPCSNSSSRSSITSPYNSSSSNNSPQASTSSSSQQTTAPDDEQPCCSRSLITPPTTSATETAAKAKRAAKRKFNETKSSEEGSRPRKCKKKTHNIEPLSPSTPQPQKRKRASRACLKNPLNEPPWKMALRCRDPRYKDLKKQLNSRYLQQFQQECVQAMSDLDSPQKLLAHAWNDLAQNTPETRPEPIILFKRLLRRPSRLNWKKLSRAVSMLTTTATSGTAQRLGTTTAGKAIKWLKCFFQNLEGWPRPRHLICGSNFTRLCGQALSAQQVQLAPQNETRLTPEENRMCFLSVDDLARATSDQNVLTSEHSVVFLRHQDEPRSTTSQGDNGLYPIQEFEEHNNTE